MCMGTPSCSERDCRRLVALTVPKTVPTFPFCLCFVPMVNGQVRGNRCAALVMDVSWSVEVVSAQVHDGLIWTLFGGKSCQGFYTSAAQNKCEWGVMIATTAGSVPLMF